MKKSGFSLVELAIVLVIVGLIIGGIMVGRSMISTAHTQSIISDFQKYSSAAQNYFTKYNYWPGDDAERTTKWSGAAGNGDGDGTLEDATTPSEYYYFWQDLSYAGFITGNYSGTATASAPIFSVPKSQLRNGWITHYYDGSYPANQALYLTFSTSGSNTIGGTTLSAPTTFILSGPNALSIDTKIDDGLPNQQTALSGNVIAIGNTGSGDCKTGTGAADTYRANTTAVCNIYFIYKK